MLGRIESPQRTLHVRLLADGRVQPGAGGLDPAPANWQITRCWRYSGVEECLIRATVERGSYFANIEAAALADIETGDGMLVRIERFSKR